MAIRKLSSDVGVYFDTNTPPTISGKAGEEYYVTSDGTSAGDITERWINDGSSWVNTPMSDAEAATTATLIALGEITEDMTGFVDRTSSDYSFVDATRTYTLAPTGASFFIWHRGTPYTISSPLSIVIDPTPGGRYIIFDPTTQQLAEVLPVGSHPSIKGQALVGYVYWDGATATILGDERHSVSRDTQWHYNQHLDVGAIWRSGGSIAYTEKDDSAVGIAFSSPIKIADEDLEHTITHSASPTAHYEQILDGSAILPVIYLDGTHYTETSNGTVPWLHDGSVAVYNEITGGSGALTQLSNSTFVNYWVLFSNDSRAPVKLVLGRAEHSTLNDAENEPFEDYGLSLPEMVIGYKIICYYKSSYINNEARIWIEKVLTITGEQNQASVFSTTAHQNLTGTTLPDTHPIEAITGLRAELDLKLETETNTTLALNSNSLDYTDELGNTTNIDLSVYDVKTLAALDDTDVGTLAPVNLDLLAFDAADSTWKPAYSPKVVFRTNDLAGAVPDLYASRTEVTVAYPINDTILWMSSDLSYGVAFPPADGTTKNPYYTVDGGLTWYPSTSTYSDAAGYGPNRVFELGNTLVVGFSNSGSRFMTSTDNGITWNTITTAPFYYWHFYTWAYFKNIDMLFQTSMNRVVSSSSLGTSSDTLSETINVSKFAEHPTLAKGIILDGNNIHQVTGYNTFVMNVGTVPGTIIDLFYSEYEDAYIAASWNTTSLTIQLNKSSDDGVTWTPFGQSHTQVNGFTFPMFLESHEYGTGQLLYRFRNSGPNLFYDIITDTWSEAYWDSGQVGYTESLFTTVGATNYVGIHTTANGQPLGLYVGEMETAASVATGSTFYPEYTIDDLDNTSVSTKQDGDFLSWDATADKWVSSTLNVTTTLVDLTDTTITSPASGEALLYDGSSWVNQALPSGVTTLAALDDTDVVTNAPEASAVLMWDSTTSKWIPAHVPMIEPIAPEPPTTDVLFGNYSDIPGVTELQTEVQQSVISMTNSKAFVIKNSFTATSATTWFTTDFVTVYQPWATYGVPIDYDDVISIGNSTHILYDISLNTSSSNYWYTTDNGATWTEHTTSKPSFNYSYWFSTGDMIIVSFGATQAYSTDGINWTTGGPVLNLFAGGARFNAYPIEGSPNKYLIGNRTSNLIYVIDTTGGVPSIAHTYNISHNNVFTIGSNLYYQTYGASGIFVYRATSIGGAFTVVDAPVTQKNGTDKIYVHNGYAFMYGNGKGLVRVDDANSTVEEFHFDLNNSWFEFITYSEALGKYVVNKNFDETTAFLPWDIKAADTILNSSGVYKQYTIDDLNDTDVVSKVDGDTLIWNSTTSKWEAGAASSGASPFISAQTGLGFDVQLVNYDLDAGGSPFPTTRSDGTALGNHDLLFVDFNNSGTDAVDTVSLFIYDTALNGYTGLVTESYLYNNTGVSYWNKPALSTTYEAFGRPIGTTYYATDLNTFRTFSSTGWVDLGGSGGSVGALNDLSDTTVLSPTTGQVLRYDGSTTWYNAKLNLGDLNNMHANTNSPQDKQVLVFSAGAGNVWIPMDHETTFGQNIGGTSTEAAVASVPVTNYKIGDLFIVSDTAYADGNVKSVWKVSYNQSGQKSWNKYIDNTIDGKYDVNVTTKTDMGALVWDNTAGEWRTSSFAIGKPIFCNVRERFDDAAGTSVACTDEQIFHLDMSLFVAGGGNVAIDITGLNLTAFLATTVTFVCDNSSGSSGTVNNITIDGAAVNLMWQGGAPVAGTAGAHDIVTFSIMRMSDNSYKAFGNTVSYS